MFKNIQLTISEELLNHMDQCVEQQGMTRSMFIRKAIEAALQAQRIAEMEEQQRIGYLRQPEKPGEFDLWESEQAWG